MFCCIARIGGNHHVLYLQAATHAFSAAVGLSLCPHRWDGCTVLSAPACFAHGMSGMQGQQLHSLTQGTTGLFHQRQACLILLARRQVIGASICPYDMRIVWHSFAPCIMYGCPASSGNCNGLVVTVTTSRSDCVWCAFRSSEGTQTSCYI
jgi:hypothetical protein